MCGTAPAPNTCCAVTSSGWGGSQPCEGRRSRLVSQRCVGSADPRRPGIRPARVPSPLQWMSEAAVPTQRRSARPVVAAVPLRWHSCRRSRCAVLRSSAAAFRRNSHWRYLSPSPSAVLPTAASAAKPCVGGQRSVLFPPRPNRASVAMAVRDPHIRASSLLGRRSGLCKRSFCTAL